MRVCVCKNIAQQSKRDRERDTKKYIVLGIN